MLKTTIKTHSAKDIQSAHQTLVRLAESSFGLRNDHLERGTKMTDSFIFLPEVQGTVCEILQTEWKEMVSSSSMTAIRGDITEEFNSAVVHLFRGQLKSFLGSSSPLRLHRIPHM